MCEFYSFSVLWLRRRCAKKVKEKDVLIPGKVSEFVFPLLMELSSVRGERVIYALRDFLVWGYTRKEVCERYGVTYSYFSKALKRVCRVGNIIVCLLEHYPFIH
ncbi:transcriptional regulator [Escherichia coli]|nr:transcriptional regulator [Escherichia coli]NEN57982.1 transcriptional regulator [Escherichia coli]